MRSLAQALFPPGVAGAELERLEDAGPLQGAERELASGFAPPRALEFAAGRHCAREALRALGLPPEPLLRGEGREPLWPPGIVGSISHATGYCGAVVARTRTCRGLGFDVEEWGRMRPALWRRIATPAEREWLGAQDAQGERWATVLFSAKEAFYKAQYPCSATFLGFQAAAFHPTGPDRFEIELLRDVAGVGGAGARIRGRWAADALRCYTGIWLPPAPDAGFSASATT